MTREFDSLLTSAAPAVQELARAAEAVAVLKARVNLGFYYGADLDDPNGLLEGTGKALRHVKVHDAAVLKDPALRRLVTEACGHFPKLKG